MPRAGSLDLEPYRVPCPRCPETWFGITDANGYFEPCRIRERSVARAFQRRGKPLPESDRVHRERVGLARQWIGAGRPHIVPLIGMIRVLLIFGAR